MNKLKVFSEKLGRDIHLPFDGESRLALVEGEDVSSNFAFAWTDNGWSNSFDRWLDNGWNNSFDSWNDKGWNNSFESWSNKGWNNSFESWHDGGWSNNSWSDGGWSDSGGCYITTACVQFKGLDDNCHELSVLRSYRDKLIKEDEDFRSKVLEYYRKAPLIVQQINADSEKNSILEHLYQDMICPCVSMLENGEIEEAKKLYLESYEELAHFYLDS